MKLDELRKLILGYSEQDLRLLIVEIHKQLPRAKASDAQLEEVIRNPALLREQKQPRAAKPAPRVDLESLEGDIEEFVAQAKAGNYYAPNREISKSERQRWRFTVMRFYKELNAASGQEQNRALVADLLEQLYRILSSSCENHLFYSEDPFAAIKVRQSRFLSDILKLYREHLPLGEFVSRCIDLTLGVPYSRDDPTTALIRAAIAFLDTTDLREMVIEQLTDRLRPLQAPGSSAKHDYKQQSRMEDIGEFGAACCFALHEPDRAIEFFNKANRHRDPEIRLYWLLHRLEKHNLTREWIREYEAAVARRVNPRNSLRTEYDARRAQPPGTGDSQ